MPKLSKKILISSSFMEGVRSVCNMVQTMPCETQDPMTKLKASKSMLQVRRGTIHALFFFESNIESTMAKFVPLILVIRIDGITDKVFSIQ